MRTQPLKNQVIIIVPIYRSFTDNERVSLNQLLGILSNYEKCFIAPEHSKTDLSPYLNIKTKTYSDKYFASPQTYSKLMLTRNFYQDYNKYKFILIYQLDTLVFSDKLLYWCNKDYDYIGAPSFFSLIGKLTHAKSRTDFVLNGGLSLRKVETFINVLKKAGSKALNYPFNEDGFWSFEAPKYLDSYKTPDFKTALSFAFEKNPKKCFKLNNNKLPFGCHAWERYDKNFWLPYINKH